MLSHLKSYLFGAADEAALEGAAVGDCTSNNGAEDDWVLVDTQGSIIIAILIKSNYYFLLMNLLNISII